MISVCQPRPPDGPLPQITYQTIMMMLMVKRPHPRSKVPVYIIIMSFSAMELLALEGEGIKAIVNGLTVYVGNMNRIK
mgnify:CR=1 FL=1